MYPLGAWHSLFLLPQYCRAQLASRRQQASRDRPISRLPQSLEVMAVGEGSLSLLLLPGCAYRPQPAGGV